MFIAPKKIIEDGILTKCLDQELQVQQNGVDLTVKSIKSVIDHGTVTTDKKLVAERGLVNFVQDDGEVFLKPGVYDIEFNEHVTLPNGVCALLIQRSSVNRNGVLIQAGLYDAGFSNYVGGVLYVINPLGFRTNKNARLAQIAFSTAEEGSLYDGVYNENK